MLGLGLGQGHSRRCTARELISWGSCKQNACRGGTESSIEHQGEEEDAAQSPTKRGRHRVLACATLASIINAFMFMNFSPIVELSRRRFRATEGQVSWLYSAALLATLPCFFAGATRMSNADTQRGAILAIHGLNAVAALLRLAAVAEGNYAAAPPPRRWRWARARLLVVASYAAVPLLWLPQQERAAGVAWLVQGNYAWVGPRGRGDAGGRRRRPVVRAIRVPPGARVRRDGAGRAAPPARERGDAGAVARRGAAGRAGNAREDHRGPGAAAALDSGVRLVRGRGGRRLRRAGRRGRHIWGRVRCGAAARGARRRGFHTGWRGERRVTRSLPVRETPAAAARRAARGRRLGFRWPPRGDGAAAVPAPRRLRRRGGGGGGDDRFSSGPRSPKQQRARARTRRSWWREVSWSGGSRSSAPS